MGRKIEDNLSDINYELKYLRLENEMLKKAKKTAVSEQDIKLLLELSMRMRELLERCRMETLPVDLAREIDRAIKELESY